MSAKTLIWKIRFVVEIRRLLKLPLRVSWDYAESWLESLNGDTTEDPLEAAREEYEEWCAHP